MNLNKSVDAVIAEAVRTKGGVNALFYAAAYSSMALTEEDAVKAFRESRAAIEARRPATALGGDHA